MNDATRRPGRGEFRMIIYGLGDMTFTLDELKAFTGIIDAGSDNPDSPMVARAWTFLAQRCYYIAKSFIETSEEVEPE